MVTESMILYGVLFVVVALLSLVRAWPDYALSLVP